MWGGRGDEMEGCVYICVHVYVDALEYVCAQASVCMLVWRLRLRLMWVFLNLSPLYLLMQGLSAELEAH